MKKILLSSVAFLGLTAGAMAADLPSRRAAPAPYVAVPVFTWTGFYVGVNAGYGFDVGTNANNPYAVSPAGPATLSAPLGGYTGTVFPGGNGNRDGFVGGGQIGYNYQIGNFVVGLEADIQYADLVSNRSGTTVLVPGVAGFFGATGNRQGVDWFGTVRGRVGYAWDRLLVFGTGGFAYGDGPDNCNSTFAAGRCVGNNDIRTGWAAGGGVEYAFTPNLTGKLEALYVNLDRNAASRYVGDFVAGGTATPVFVNGRGARDEEFVVVRAGLNYKFGTF
ncbi:outer membrane protein [Enterovirga aerilata]|uniref:Porin family protein n=1 Tax=Enterovirga aerilata TaxID=2730920 RepID=A0A849HXG6_9HYPH|nr:outer membrane beta-barrel protein [Enterovirga sp. DB1703]NNM71802.1 porin family protein [Enterovirga sp. DB1703]